MSRLAGLLRPTRAIGARPPGPPSRSLRATLALFAVVTGLAGCATPTPPAPPAPRPSEGAPAPSPAADAHPGAGGEVVGRGESLLVYLPRRGDTLAGVAARFYGAADQAWRIAEANGQHWDAAPGDPLVVPLAPRSPYGVSADGVQTVPILCYHRFGPGGAKMTVSPSQFEAQLDWLARNHYRVLRLGDLAGFLAGREPLPQRSVVITIDDGYESTYRVAAPLLAKYGFPATVFVYTDFVGSPDAMSWAQLRELASGGLIEIQAHSKTHRNLIQRATAESDAEYRQSVDDELRLSRTTLERQLAPAGVRVRHFAYPYGDANDVVLDAMRRQGWDSGVTVNPGGNPFFAHPLVLRRTMIFGDQDLDTFKSRVQILRSLARP